VTTIALALFWGSALLLVLVYVAFPIGVLLRGWLRPRPHRLGDITPRVSVVIAAHNEASSIAARLDNLLSLDYPPDHLEIIVASDGSTDATEATVADYEGRGVRLLALPRVGKVAALNGAIEVAGGEIVAFSDANSHWVPGSLRALVRPFADPDVGGVAGDQRYMEDSPGRTAGQGERSYWDLERRIKQAQSRAGSVISATGAIYAVRRSLVSPLPPGVSDDFVMSARVVERGYRLVFAPDALAFEPVAPTNGAEFGRKLRAIQLGLCGVVAVRSLLNPFRHGFSAVQLLFHKVLRRLAAFPLLLLLATSTLLWSHGPLYRASALAGVAFGLSALAGLALEATPLGRMKLFSLPAYFCLVYTASVVATVRVLRGRRLTSWDTLRQHLDAGEAAS
jgi:glycosyltransferase involved in cell wall biosynthesis